MLRRRTWSTSACAISATTRRRSWLPSAPALTAVLAEAFPTRSTSCEPRPSGHERVIAREQRRPVDTLPAEAAISAMTLAELELGVLAADDADVRGLRADTMADVEEVPQRRQRALPIEASTDTLLPKTNLRPRVRQTQPVSVEHRTAGRNPSCGPGRSVSGGDRQRACG